MEVIKVVSQILSVVIQCGTIVTLIYALTKFLGKPNHDQNERLTKVEDHLKEVDRRLDIGDSHFDDIDEGNKAMLKAMLALVDHAIDNNHVEKLVEAKDEVQRYLISR